MLKKLHVDRNFIEWLAEILPEYQHEDVSPLGDNIRHCLATESSRFTVIVRPAIKLKSVKFDPRRPKGLIKAYFHNLILVKITPE